MTARLSLEDARERRARVVSLTRAGHTAPEIAETFGISVRSVTRIRREMGISGPVPVELSEDELRRAATLLDDGCSYCEVARTLGRAPSTISRHFPGRGWPPGDGARFAQALRWELHRAAGKFPIVKWAGSVAFTNEYGSAEVFA